MKRTRHLTAGLGALLCAALALPASSALGSHEASKPIVVGFAIAKTGFVVPYDVPGSIAWEIVIAKQNAKGGLLGHPIKTVYSDAKSDINAGAIAGQEVVSKGANFVVVTCDYNYGGGAARVANSHYLVVFSLCAGDPHFGRQGIGPYAFTPSYGTPTEGAAMAEFAYKEGWRHPYLLIDTSIDFSKSLCAYFEQRWKMYPGGSGIAGKDTFTDADPTVVTQVTRLKGTPKADSVILCSYPPAGASVLRQVRAAGVKLPVVGGDAFDGEF